MSGTISQGQGSAAAIPISGGYYPPEGSRIVGAVYSWLAGNRQYEEDLSYYVSEGLMTTIQSVWIDNSLCQFPITFQVRGTGQTIIVPGLTQGLYPCFFSGGPRFKIAGVSSAGEGSIPSGSDDNYTRVLFLNIPSSTLQYSVSGSDYALLCSYVTYSAITDGLNYATFVNYPGDVRIVFHAIQVYFSFTTGPAAAGNASILLIDGSTIIWGGVLSFTAADTSAKNVSIPLQGYLQRKVGSNLVIRISGFPAGASGGNLIIDSQFALIPVIF